MKTDLSTYDATFEKLEDGVAIEERNPTSLFCSLFDDALIEYITK